MAQDDDSPRTMDLGDDPFDPHGDGTIRKGDPAYDLLMSGSAVLGNRREDGLWDVEVSGEPLEAPSEGAAASQGQAGEQEVLPANMLLDYIQQNRVSAALGAFAAVLVLLVLIFGT